MTAAPMTIDFYFDFLCPFAYRTALWMDNVREQLGDAVAVEWKYFSLEEINKGDRPTWHLWEQAEDYPNPRPDRGQDLRGLLAFWGAEAARQQGPDAFDRFRVALYHARHRDNISFSQRANVENVAAQVGLDMDQFRRDFADRTMLEALRRDHTEACEKYDVFGVPTLVFDHTDAIFVRTMTVPPAEETVPLFNELRQSFTGPRRDWLGEVKRPNPGELR